MICFYAFKAEPVLCFEYKMLNLTGIHPKENCTFKLLFRSYCNNQYDPLANSRNCSFTN